MNLPPELLDLILSQLPYHDLIRLARSLYPILSLDDHLWITKATLDFNVAPARFWDPNPMDCLVLQVGESDFPRFRYLQILSRRSVTFGAERFLGLEECVIRAVKIRKTDLTYGQTLVDYFTAQMVDLMPDGLAFCARAIAKGAMINGDFSLFRMVGRTCTLIKPPSLTNTSWVTMFLEYAVEGGNVDIILWSLKELERFLGTQTYNVIIDPHGEIRSLLADHHHYDLFRDPRLVEMIPELTDYSDHFDYNGETQDEFYIDYNRFDLVSDIRQYYGSEELGNNIRSAPLSMIKDYIKAGYGSDWGTLMEEAIEHSDMELAALIKDKMPPDYEIESLDLFSVPDSDLLFDLVEGKVTPDNVIISSPKTRADVLWLIDRRLLGQGVIEELVLEQRTDLIILLDSLLGDGEMKKKVQKYLKK